MDFKHLLAKLEKNPEYEGWKKMHPGSFLSYVLKTMDDHSEQPWHFGFYNETSEKMITFLVQQDSLQIQPEEAVFKAPGAKIQRIDLDKVTATFDEIMDNLHLFLKANYGKEMITKWIFILQNIEPMGTIWNVTLIAKNMNAINMKIDSKDCRVLHHKMDNLMNFMKKE